MRHHSYDGPEPLLVRRAAITLKSCDDCANGSLVAAPTSSLPAPVGGVRNWDYRYTWVRDAAFSVWALRRIGCEDEVSGFLGWVLDAFEGTRSPRIMYDVAGGEVPDEWEDPELEGYRASAPVRWGNGAADQRQHDVYGEVLDCAHLRVANGRPIDARLWKRLATLADAANIAWRQPDQGIWEVRSEGRVFTYSAAMCQVALDRAARIARRLGFGARREGPELFFPVGSVGPALAQIAEAKAVCTRCPVREACLRFALSTGQGYGIWGGLTEDERRNLRRRQRLPGPTA